MKHQNLGRPLKIICKSMFYLNVCWYPNCEQIKKYFKCLLNLRPKGFIIQNNSVYFEFEAINNSFDFNLTAI